MEKGINIPVSTTGAEKASEQIEKLAAAERKLADAGQNVKIDVDAPNAARTAEQLNKVTEAQQAARSQAVDIHTHVIASGAEKTVKDLDQVADASSRAEKETSKNMHSVRNNLDLGGGVKDADKAAKNIKDSAKAKKDDAQASRELDERNRTLAERFRALGPEAAIVGDTIDALTLKQGAAAAAVGALGVAVLAGTMIYQKWNEYSEKQKQIARELTGQLIEQAGAYKDVARKILEVQLAVKQGNQQGSAMPARDIAALAAKGTAAAGLGKENYEQVSEGIAASKDRPSEEEARYLAMWQFLHGKDVEASGRMPQFRAYMRRDNARQSLEKDMADFRKRFPDLQSDMSLERQKIATQFDPKAIALKAFEDAFNLMKQQYTDTGGLPEWWPKGKDDKEQIEYLRSFAGREISKRPGAKNWNIQVSNANKFLKQIAETNPDLAQKIAQGGIFGEASFSDFWTSSPSWESPKANIESFRQLMPDYSHFNNEQIETALYNMRAGGSSFTQVFNGGTHYHNNDKTDPAGKPVPMKMR